MYYMTRIVLIFFLILSTAFAGKLEIKIDGQSIDLPYWAALKKNYGSVLLINGDVQQQSSILLTRLAKELSQYGWNVGFLNRKNNASVPWEKQFSEIIAALRAKKSQRVILVHYGEQLKRTFDFLEKPPVPEIEGLILLSAYNIPPIQEKTDLNMPVFDIVGQFDLVKTKEEVEQRKKEYKNNKKNYLALEIPGAHHDYNESSQLLFSFIHGWMVKLPKLKPSPPPIMYS